MSKVKYTKPNGTEIEINATEEAKAYVKSLGWKETNRLKKQEEPKEEPKKEQQLDKIS